MMMRKWSALSRAMSIPIVPTTTLAVENHEPAIFTSLAPLFDMQTVLPSHRSIFTPVPGKPPLQNTAALKFWQPSLFLYVSGFCLDSTADARCPRECPTKNLLPVCATAASMLLLRQRICPHHSIITLVDGLLFTCFRVRLERDVCAATHTESFCARFDTGESPTSTFCGLFLPHQHDLHNALRAVEYERGYGVFMMWACCGVWDQIEKITWRITLLSWFFASPDGEG
jgi:hypothetical protein